jgi:DNA-3-methyladenine glycosylase
MRRGAASVARDRRLGREWFARDTVRVARDLIGCTLLVDADGEDAVVARIVETEAYLGTTDPASHAYRGPTRRAAIMFREPGHLYVYLSYGVHHCANIVTEPDGVAGAVLLRAAAVERGDAAVRRRRGGAHDGAALLRGPGNLCRGLGVSLLDNGIDVCSAGARLQVVPRDEEPEVWVATRVGVSVAAGEPLRFAWKGDPAVSSPVPWPAGKK